MEHFKEKGRFEMNIDMKKTAVDDPFTEVPPAEHMIVFLSQHIGEEAESLVKVGDRVKYGQKIGDIDDEKALCTPVHSPVNGKIVETKKIKNPISGNHEIAIVIKTENEEKKNVLEPLDPKTATRKQLIDRVKEAGIVGLGGASFPSHVKLGSKSISHLIINAKESDPNIACDFRLMVEKPKELVKGIKLMGKMLDVEQIIFATRTKEGTTPEFEALLRDNDILIKRIRPNYSVGSEKLLIKEILGIEVPAGQYAPDIGVIVHNIATAYAVWDAVYTGETLVSRGITFYSKETKGKNLWVRMGTPVNHILECLKLSPTNFNKIVLGSIMMGPTISDPSYPVLKATSAITAFQAEEHDPYENSLPCIRCSYCNIVCPVDIYPQLIMDAVKKDDVNMLRKLHVEVCIECGLCSYVCPSRINFTQFLRDGKKAIRD